MDGEQRARVPVSELYGRLDGLRKGKSIRSTPRGWLLATSLTWLGFDMAPVVTLAVPMLDSAKLGEGAEVLPIVTGDGVIIGLFRR